MLHCFESLAMRGLMMVIFEEAGTLSKRSKTKPKESSKKRKKKTVEELELELQSFNEEIGTIFLMPDSGSGGSFPRRPRSSR